MRAVDYIAKRLASEGIDTVFLVQGSANNDLIYSIADTPGIRYVCAQHEQAAGFMAEAYAKVTGRVGCAITTSGPGGQNLTTAIANCWYDSVPVLFITGQVNSRFMRRSAALRQLGFQEWPAVECLRPILKSAELVRSAERVPGVLERALCACQGGRPGPALLDLPIDVQRGDPGLQFTMTNWHQSQMSSMSSAKPEAWLRVEQQVRALVDDLKRARRPVVLVGGGVRSPGAVAALNKFAHLAGAPLFPTWNALDVVASDHPWYGGRVGTYAGPGRNFAIQNCDLLLAIGSRISGRITGGRPETFARGAKKYVVDVDPGLLDPANQEVHTDVSIHCDAESFLRELVRQWLTAATDHDQDGNFSRRPECWGAWAEHTFRWRDRYDTSLPRGKGKEMLHFYDFVRRLSDLTPSNAVVVYDCGGNAVVMAHTFRTKTGQRVFSNHGNSPMGFALAAAIGAWFADPSRPVICVIGDGGMQVNIQELQTLKNYGANVKVFVLDNRVYGITQAFQETHYPSRKTEASGPEDYSAPDFVGVARAYGLSAFKIFYASQVDGAIQTMLASDGPRVCVVSSPGFHDYWPKIDGWATPIEDMSPRLPRDEFRANMIVDPLLGWETGEYR